MKNYIVYSKDGNLLKTGICPKDALHMMADPMKEEYVIEGEAHDMIHEVADFVVQERKEPLKHPEPTYQELRNRAYPRIEQYLDAQVKINSDDLGLIAEGKQQLQEYTQQCLKVKSMYPKPPASK